MILAALNAWCWTETELYATNTIEHHPEWIVPEHMYGPTRGDNRWTSRNLLAGNQLNLSVWFGFNEVVLAAPVTAEELSFRCRLAPQAYVYVFLREGRALRLSRYAPKPGAMVELDPKGGLVRERPLTGALPQDDAWHRYTLRWSKGAWSLQVDAGEPLPVAGWEPATGRVSFQGGFRDVSIDDVEIRRGGQRVFSEGFRNRQGAGLLFWASFALALGVAALAVRCWKRESYLRACLLLGVLLFSTLSWLVFDQSFWSSRYVLTEESASPWAVEIERLRRALADTLDPALPPRRSRPPRTYRPQVYGMGPDTIVLLGTSQTWGLGASRLEYRLGAQLQALMPATRVVNGARPGDDAARQVRRYLHELASYRPRLVAVNLGNNDTDPRKFASSLGQLVRYNDAHGIQTVFFREANAPETLEEDPHLFQNHAILASLGKPCHDLHRHLAGLDSSGILWRDFVHLTDYGQSLAARYMATALQQPVAASSEAIFDLGPLSESAFVENGLYEGEGEFTWTQGSPSRFHLAWAGARQARLSIHARPVEGVPVVTARVSVNGVPAGKLRWEAGGFATRELAVTLRPGDNLLSLAYDQVRRLGPGDSREGSLCLDWLRLGPDLAQPLPLPVPHRAHIEGARTALPAR